MLEKRMFDSYEERRDALFDLQEYLGGTSKVETLKHNKFLLSPASTKYHGNYPGGLFDHSYNTALVLLQLTVDNGLVWENSHSPIRIGILHDLCKLDQYQYDECTDSWVYRQDMLLKGHGIKSVVYALKFGFNLNMEEIACITYHMGAFDDKEGYSNAIHKYSNVLWTHTADMISSQILGV